MWEALGTLFSKIGWLWIRKQFKKFQQSFFRKPVGHFVSPETYLSAYLGENGSRNSITHELDCVGREAELKNIVKKVDEGNGSVFVVSAPAGYGKSKFAFEIAKRLRGDGYGFFKKLWRWVRGKTWKTYFLQKYSDHALEFVHELRKKPRIAIFLDDSHEYPELIRALSIYSGTSQEEGTLLVFCFCRSALRNTVIDALGDIQPDIINNIELPKLKNDNIKELIKEIIPDARESVKNKIFDFTKDSVFLTILVCQQIKNGKEFSDSITQPQFRRRLCDAPLEEVIQVCGVSLNKAKYAISVIAAASPVKYDDLAIKEIACKLGDISNVDYDCLINRVIESGLFSTYANKLIRPTPDLVGDLILDSACINDDATPNDFSKQLINSLLSKYSRNTLNNVADIGWTIGEENSVDLVSPVLIDIKNNVNSYSIEDIESIISVIEPLGFRRAKLVTEIVTEIFNKARNIIADDEVDSKAWKRLLSETIPILQSSIYDIDAAECAMNVLKSYAIEELVDTIDH